MLVPLRRGNSAALVLLLGLATCIHPSEPKNGFSISLSSDTLSLVVGSTATLTVNITRMSYAGAVSVAFNSPTGILIASDSGSTMGNAMTIQVTALGTLAVGNYDAGIVATGGGASHGATLKVSVAKPPVTNRVLLFVVPSAIDASSYLSEYAISINANYQVLLRLDPALTKADVLETNYSPSYAPSGKYWYSTADRIFVAQEFGSSHNIIERNLETFAAIGSNPSLGPNSHYRGCNAVVGSDYYYRVEPNGSTVGNLYRVSLSGGSPQLLVAYNADDYYNCHQLLSDQGHLYDVWAYPSNANPDSWTLYERNLATGAVGDIKVYVPTSITPYVSYGNRYVVDNGTFYYLRQRTADKHVEVWQTAVTGGASPTKIFDADVGFAPYFFDVDDGHLMLASLGTDVSPKNAKVYLQDLTTGTVQQISLGVSITNIVQVFAKP